HIPLESDPPALQKGDWVQFIPAVAGGSGEPPRPRATQERAALPPPPAALVPPNFWDVKNLEWSQGSLILDSQDPQNPWKVKLEYVRGDDQQAAVKITPLGGDIEIKGPGQSDFGSIDPAKSYSLNDDFHLRLGGGEYYFGSKPNALMGQGYLPLE